MAFNITKKDVEDLVRELHKASLTTDWDVYVTAEDLKNANSSMEVIENKVERMRSMIEKHDEAVFERMREDIARNLKKPENK